MRQRHAFELFRFDFMVDEAARPLLTEVNLSPNMVPAHPEDGRVKAALLKDALRLVSVRPARGEHRDAARHPLPLGGFRPIGGARARTLL